MGVIYPFLLINYNTDTLYIKIWDDEPEDMLYLMLPRLQQFKHLAFQASWAYLYIYRDAYLRQEFGENLKTITLVDVVGIEQKQFGDEWRIIELDLKHVSPVKWPSEDLYDDVAHHEDDSQRQELAKYGELAFDAAKACTNVKMLGGTITVSRVYFSLVISTPLCKPFESPLLFQSKSVANMNHGQLAKSLHNSVCQRSHFQKSRAHQSH